MGRNVLDVKPINANPNVHFFGHCTRKQNSFSKMGAMTVLLVNNGTFEHTTSLKLPTISQPKTIEVQSYILTSPSSNSAEVYLNGNKLILDTSNVEMMLIPKIRRARFSTHLSLSVPPKSLGFFVIPGARVPICINSENEINEIRDEIDEDQNISFEDDHIVELQPRISENSRHTSLNELYKMMEKELEADERFYRQTSRKENNKDWMRILLERARETKRSKTTDPPKVESKNELRQLLTGNVKALEKHKKKLDLKNLLLGKTIELEKRKEAKKALIGELTSEEMDKILSERDRTKRIQKLLTSAEFDEILAMTSKKYRKARSSTKKRAINMEQLKLKTDYQPDPERIDKKKQELEADLESKENFPNEEPKKSKHKNKLTSFKLTALKEPFPKKQVFPNIFDESLLFGDDTLFDKPKNTAKESNKELFETYYEDNLKKSNTKLDDDIEALLSDDKPTYEHVSYIFLLLNIDGFSA